MTISLDKYAYEGLLSNPNITEEIIDILLAKKPNNWLLEAVANSKNASASQLDFVYQESRAYSVLYDLARNPNTPSQILDSIFDKHKNNVCQNTQIPKQLISKVLLTETSSKDSQKDFDSYSKALARNPALSEKEDQLILAKKMSQPQNLFMNPNLHAEVFEQLWDCGCTDWAGHFSKSQHFSEKHANMMLATDDEAIRAAAIHSQYATKEVVVEARSDDSGKVRTAAFANHLIPIDYADLDWTDLPAILGVVNRNDVPEEILIKIAEMDFPSHSDIKFVLARAKAPIKVLEILFNQGEVAPSNPNLSVEILEQCITKGDKWDRLFALGNPSISRSKLKDYLGLEEGNHLKSKAKLFYELPEWYRHLTNEIDKLNCCDDALNKSLLPRIFIPEISDTPCVENKIIGVIGGYFYKSDLGDRRIEQGYAQPIVQIDLSMLSQTTGIYFGSSILQVWGDEDDWGQGNPALCETIDHDEVTNKSDMSCIDVQLPEHLINANQYDQATACFDWSESIYANELGLRAPFFISGLDDAGLNVRLVSNEQYTLLLNKIAEANLNQQPIKDYYETSSFQDFSNEINALHDIQKLELGTSFGNFDDENLARFLEEFDDDFDYIQYLGEEFFETSGEWLPLMTLHGPLYDEIDDFYSIFYSQTKDGAFQYKAMAHRWCY